MPTPKSGPGTTSGSDQTGAAVLLSEPTGCERVSLLRAPESSRCPFQTSAGWKTHHDSDLFRALAVSDAAHWSAVQAAWTRCGSLVSGSSLQPLHGRDRRFAIHMSLHSQSLFFLGLIQGPYPVLVYAYYELHRRSAPAFHQLLPVQK